jgi:hypothetical protein
MVNLNDSFIIALEIKTRWDSWLRHCPTNRKVACSIPSGLTIAVGLTLSLTEMNTTDVSWGVKAAGV